MRDVMIDIETFGNGKRATLVQIGAVYFNRETGELGKEFEANIDARDSILCGSEIDADTVYWWLSQSKEAIEAITRGPLMPLRQTMLDLYQYTQGAKSIWSHATFDFVIIQETFKMLNLKPLNYRIARDIRTLVDLASLKREDIIGGREGTHHNALDDAKFQVKYCVAALNKLKNK